MAGSDSHYESRNACREHFLFLFRVARGKLCSRICERIVGDSEIAICTAKQMAATHAATF